VGIIGLLQANEVLKMILGIGEVLNGKILVYNILNNEQQKYSFDRSDIQSISRKSFEEKYNKSEVAEISFDSVLEEINNDSVLFLDVRNTDELPKISLKNLVQIPLLLLENEIEKLDKNQMIYVFCQSGIRSKMALELLQKHQFKNVKSIAGGVLAMKKLLKEEIKI
ncbi:MAG: rhodanese-like domain-containing protein, partial [Flavobacterium sp.]